MSNTLPELTENDISGMSYNDVIGLVRETNRPPGGIRSIVRIIQNAFLTTNDHVLDIGTSTGITAIEIGRLTGARVEGIDVNPTSLEEARRRCQRLGLQDRVTFKIDDAQALSSESEHFDLVFCGNVTSLITSRSKALSEYTRVLKPGGFLAAVPMYYVEEPPPSLVDEVSRAIQVPLEPMRRADWMSFFRVKPYEVFLAEDYRFERKEDREIEAFVKRILDRNHLLELSKEAKRALDQKYTEYMHLFNENLSHMGYSVLLLRKDLEALDPELFTGNPVIPRPDLRNP